MLSAKHCQKVYSFLEPQRAFAAFLAISLRFSGLSFFARARPPLFPRDTAFGSFPLGLGGDLFAEAIEASSREMQIHQLGYFSLAVRIWLFLP